MDTCYFCAPMGVQKCLLGSLPKPGTSGQHGPKLAAARPPCCVMSLSLHFLIFTAAGDFQQPVDIRLDGHDLPHFSPHFFVIGKSRVFLVHQLLPLLFERVHLWQLATAQNAGEDSPRRPMGLYVGLMLRKIFLAVLGGLVPGCLQISSSCRQIRYYVV